MGNQEKEKEREQLTIKSGANCFVGQTQLFSMLIRQVGLKSQSARARRLRQAYGRIYADNYASSKALSGKS